MDALTKLEAFSDHCWDLLRHGERIKLETEVFGYGYDGVWIARLFVPRKLRGFGYAREAMEQICRSADEEDVKLLLDVCPYDAGGLTHSALTTFYESLGFELNEELLDGSIMIRHPNAF